MVLVVEIGAGIGSDSFSLIMDGIHNLSDEVALALLVLPIVSERTIRKAAALCKPVQLRRTFGDLRLPHFPCCRAPISPCRSFRSCPNRCRLIGAAANWGVARVLRGPSKEDVAIRLASVHNFGFADSGHSRSSDLCLGKFYF